MRSTFWAIAGLLLTPTAWNSVRNPFAHAACAAPSRRLRAAPGRLPPGQRVYAIGDVHGCVEQLRRLYARIAEDLRRYPIEHATLIHLGDYLDRGPDSAEVIELVRTGPLPPVDQVVRLMGNHELMALAALAGDRGHAPFWLQNGGAATLRSWGADPAADRAEWLPHIPPAQLGFLMGLTLSHRQGAYLFVHAGVRPEVELHDQTRADMTEIREPFLNWRGDFGAIVVHGHSRVRHPVVRRNRIAIDTGAGFGGLSITHKSVGSPRGGNRRHAWERVPKRPRSVIRRSPFIWGGAGDGRSGGGMAGDRTRRL